MKIPIFVLEYKIFFKLKNNIENYETDLCGHTDR